ncbi:MAG TPA: hypothetical protein DEO64_17750 [Alcaligenes faecalis]|nr:hypothetical protein [Alcaligenes faecalis]
MSRSIRRPAPSAGLALSLRSLPVGMAYAIWSGIDTFGLRLLDIICAC